MVIFFLVAKLLFFCQIKVVFGQKKYKIGLKCVILWIKINKSRILNLN